MEKIYLKDFHPDDSGKINVTDIFQCAINEAADKKVTLFVNKGTYLVTSLFLKSGMNLEFEDGAELLGDTDETKFKMIPTRIAGINMDWYPGILNVNDCKDIVISGKGIINGNGHYWWNKYWGVDSLGGMRHEYDRVGLRWACDYDCPRPRNIVISNSENIVLKDVISFQAGFWNIHILYSKHCIVDSIKVDAHYPIAPSTDGIDIDSSEDVEIKNADISCNDDSICIKAGRGLEAYNQGKVCKNIHISDCRLNEGFGITIGSEVSGGIENIYIKNIEFNNTSCGLRMKSSVDRKGFIRNVFVENIRMHDVKYVFHIYTDWNKAYSECILPKNYSGEIYPHYEKLLARIPDKVENTKIENLSVINLTSDFSKNNTSICRLFNIVGFVDQPIRGVILDNVHLKGKEYGIVKNVTDIHKTDCSFDYQCILDNDLEFDNR